MSARRLQERLAHVRRQNGGSLEPLARRCGVRATLLDAMEDGRFADLPSGIYGRAAVRSAAAALALPVTDTLAACEPLLTSPEDPVAGLARVRGLRPAPTVRTTTVVVVDAPPAALWRLGAAATIDGLVVAALLLVVIAATASVPDARLDAMSRTVAAPAFIVIAVALAAWYFLIFGGIAGTTAGAIAARSDLAELSRPARGADGRTIVVRAIRCACRDARCLQLLGVCTAAWIASGRARNREPVMTPPEIRV